ncbi:MAG: ATP-binding protein [Firmicutes bacterium]|nr:ATP-binding protein [Bacillota bacterium]
MIGAVRETPHYIAARGLRAIKRELKRLLGCIRRADRDFGLISDGDSIAVGVSGGKDSLALAYCLDLYRKFSKKDYRIVAVTVDTGLRPFDLSGVREFFMRLGIPYEVAQTNIGGVVFDTRQEKDPCALCANLRRGVMNSTAVRLGCNKTALGHHSEDAVNTFLMSLLYEGRLSTFAPKTYLSRRDITVLRPFVYASEQDIIAVAKGLPLPVVASPCPACGNTARARVSALVSALETQVPDVREKLRSALEGTENYHLWSKETTDESPCRDEDAYLSERENDK